MARFVFDYRVPWPDVDLAGMVYFVRFVSYFQKAETEWVRSHGMEYGEFLDRLGIWMPRVSIRCDYHAPARLDDRLAVEMKLDRMGNTSFALRFEIYRQPDRLHLADGTFVISTVSRTHLEPIRVPDQLRRMLEALSES